MVFSPRMARLRRWIFSGLLVLLAAGVVLAYLVYATLFSPLISTGAPQSIKLPPGMGVNYLMTQLQSRGWLKSEFVFLMALDYLSEHHHLKFGEYRVTPGMTLMTLLQHIMTGQGQVIHRITLVEGDTYQDWVEQLNSDACLRHRLKTLSVQTLMHSLKSSQSHPEGLFFPDTYHFHCYEWDTQILTRAYRKMQRTLKQAWATRARGLPYRTPYQALILASLVEKETAVPKERPLIAGVLVHRLRRGMRLQVDPTVAYGKQLERPVLRRDLTHDSLYNTYRHDGLPPTPIAMPGLSAIQAALHPTPTRYLYYVSEGDGSHYFSEDYDEHLRAIRRIRQQQSSWRRLGFPVAWRLMAWVNVVTLYLTLL